MYSKSVPKTYYKPCPEYLRQCLKIWLLSNYVSCGEELSFEGRVRIAKPLNCNHRYNSKYYQSQFDLLQGFSNKLRPSDVRST
jgi:hypothetical protein